MGKYILEPVHFTQLKNSLQLDILPDWLLKTAGLTQLSTMDGFMLMVNVLWLYSCGQITEAISILQKAQDDELLTVRS